jgi:hypothetical protein
MVFGEQTDKPRFLLRDHDTKFTRQVDEILEAEGVEAKAVGPRAPNMNAVAERWVQSVKQECLDPSWSSARLICDTFWRSTWPGTIGAGHTKVWAIDLWTEKFPR